jgi:hypothetical protein
MKKIGSLIIFMLLSSSIFGQITVRYFNAEWNKANSVEWCHTDKKGLKDCKVTSYDIGKDSESQKKYKIAVIPTIIIFKDGEEVARFQADLSFKMAATREEVQEEIDEQLMSDF